MEFFDWQPQAFIWLAPVWNDKKTAIEDFTYVYSNQEGLTYLKLKRSMLGEIRISNTPSLTDEMRPRILQEMIHVFTTGETVCSDLYTQSSTHSAECIALNFGREY